MLKIERYPVNIDKDTWFYVNRKSLYMVHWKEDGGRKTCSTFRVPTRLLRRTLLILAMQAGKERARRREKRARKAGGK